jgi:hypothetical protein
MTQEVDSSPAVGGFLTGGATGIVIGTGSYYGGASASNAVDAFGTDCQLVWSESLDAFTESSPALADMVGNGSLDIVQGTDNGATGEVWVLNGANGGVIWHQVLSGRVIGGSVTADLSGEGYQDVLVPTSHGVYVLDGRDGAVMTVLAPDMGFQNSPLLTDDPDGTVGLTIAGYNGGNEGVVFHYEIPGSDGAEAVGAGSWPMFHHDPQLSGTTSGLPAAGSIPACDVPSAASLGYDLASRDGAVFSVGEPYCGSVDSATLGAPVVGTAMSPSVGGYWLVTANGDVVGLGSAPTFGSLAGRHLASPVVGMAAAPDGRGYWLVSADGGVFGFGDARYWGAEAGHALSAPVVGIAPSPDGGGYWLASADGEVFGFGDAYVLGSMSGQHLAAPIVGIATDVATGGYWLLGADGGVFNFKAAFKGSMGDRRLAQPVVGLVATADGGGYWLLAADGGAFAFGDAPFIGSAAGRNNGGPIASGTGYCG